ncbi:MAG: PRC-barrel domain-containing protein [Thiobacillus sp.]
MRQARRLDDLRGYALFARDGEIGRIDRVYFDDRQWAVRYFVVHTGGWLFGRDVLIAPRSVVAVDEDSKRIELDLSREQVEKAPPIGRERPVSQHYEDEYHRHFGWQPYWENSAFGMPIPPIAPPVEPPMPSPERIQTPENPHLRDSGEVAGYRLEACDGELGHVHDLVLDDQDWTVRYVVVDTRTWWPGKKVLISPAWISQVNWADRAIVVDLARDRIRTAPAYDPDRIIGQDDEVRLYAHYGKSMQAAAEDEAAKKSDR